MSLETILGDRDTSHPELREQGFAHGGTVVALQVDRRDAGWQYRNLAELKAARRESQGPGKVRPI